MRRTSRLLLFVPFVIAIAATACLEAAPFVPNIEDVSFDPSLGVDLAASTKTASGLYYRDITVGGGTLVRSDSGGDTISIFYTGYLRSGESFDTNVDGTLFTFVTGPNSVSGQLSVIAGMDEGVRGMRAGGTRQLIIPPDLGYGGIRNGSIPPNSILIFDVEAVTVKTSAAAP
jgi:FKBP-type peptidyl-prolyl cis-trans isomerase FkpA